MKEMKIGVIGSGFITSTFGEAVREVESAAIRAVYSRTQEKGRESAQKFGGDVSVYTDLDAFLDCREINFVYIASPNSLHYAQAVKALHAGKHVICEKPFTSNLKETRALISLAKEKGLYLFEAITTVYSPNYIRLREDLGKIGEIKLIQSSYSQYSSRIEALWNGENPNIFNPEFSGGALMDLNLYNIYFTYGMFGKPDAAVYYPVLYENGIDTSGTAVLTYPGMVAVCNASKEANGINFVQIHGNKGYIYVEGGSNGKKSYVVHIGDKTESVDVDTGENRMAYELRSFAQIYGAGDLQACYASLTDTEAVMEILQWCRESGNLVFPADR